jgi:LacI family transcriptional regulator
MQRPSNPFYKALGQAFSLGERQFHDANILISQHYFDVDALAETERLVRRLGRQLDALIVVLQDHPVLRAALQEAAGRIPVVTLASDLPDTGRLGYVGMDNRAAGRVAGDLMGRLVGRVGGDIVVVSGLQQFIGQGERELGFRAVLAERHRQCRLLAVLETREQADQSEQLVRDVLARHRDVVGLYNVSSGDQGIARAIRAVRGQERITFITHELTPERRRLLVEGVVDVVIDQNPALEAAMAMEVIAAHFGRIEGRPSRFITPVQIYTWENCF